MTLRYRFTSEHRAAFGVARLCRVLAVRRRGFYEWLDAAPARQQPAAAEEELAAGHRATTGRMAAYCSRSCSTRPPAPRSCSYSTRAT
jgi:hypothetical protein